MGGEPARDEVELRRMGDLFIPRICIIKLVSSASSVEFEFAETRIDLLDILVTAAKGRSTACLEAYPI